MRASKLLDFHGAIKHFGRPVFMHEVVKFSQNNWKKFHGIHMARGWCVFKFQEEENDNTPDPHIQQTEQEISKTVAECEAALASLQARFNMLTKTIAVVAERTQEFAETVKEKEHEIHA